MMKRSQINKTIRWAMKMLKKHRFVLPSFAYWKMADWQKHKNETEMIRKTLLGWDITDFDSSDYKRIGAAAFTIRNGLLGEAAVGTPYAEKAILMYKEQVVPLHYHAIKTEDIINRGGGLLQIQLFNSKPDGSVDTESDVEFFCDGFKRRIKAGAFADITTGNSITIRPYLYHLFHIKDADTMIGEVSTINEDKTDNYFAQKRVRFSETEEDEAIDFPQCLDIENLG